MSQVSIIDIAGNHPEIPTRFNANVGFAIPIANILEIYGDIVIAGTTPVETVGSGNNITLYVQLAQNNPTSDATKVGLALFDSTDFTVDVNGFVSLASSGAGETITGNSGGALSPTMNNWNIVGDGSITTIGAVSTLTVQLTGLTNHALLIGAGTTTITKLLPGTTGQVLLTNTLNDPTWSTATYPSTTTINRILYSTSNDVVGQLTTVNQSVLTTTTGGVPTWVSMATDGKVLIGSTAGDPAAATLTAGTGITITNGSNSITIAATGAGMTWQTITASQTLVKNNGYMCISPGGALSLALPSTASSTIGDIIAVILDGATSWTITQAASQRIRFSGSQTTSGASGTLGSTAQGDTIWLVYQATGRWNVVSSQGNLTVI